MITSLPNDFLIRIKNRCLSRPSLTMPYSKYCLEITKVLKKHQYIADYSVDEKNKNDITVTLLYHGFDPAITGIKLFSTPGRRYYGKASSLPWGKSKASLIIISTSKGVMSQRQAVKLGIGGEVLAEIY